VPDPVTLGSILGATIPKLAGGVGQGLAGRSKTMQSVSVSQSQGSSVNASVSPVILVNVGGGSIDRPVAGGEIRAAPTSAYSSSVPTIREDSGEPYGLSNYLALPAPVRGRASLDVPYPLSTYAASANIGRYAGGGGLAGAGGYAGGGGGLAGAAASLGTPLLWLAGAGLMLFLLVRKGTG